MTVIHQGYGEQLVTIARPFLLTSDGRVITSALVDLDDSLRDNAQRLGCTVRMLIQLLDAEKAWRRARDDSDGAA